MVYRFCACTMHPYLLLSSMASDVLVNLTKNVSSGSGVKSQRLRSSTTSLKQFYQGYGPLTRIVVAHPISLNIQKKDRDWSHDAFNLTTRLLQLNPEFYTIWNYRRNILLYGIFANK